ncbi:hypothetical protein TNCV_819961 [Trichonephila clavipes]|nr:hypothetical protein TNCV_819961 [Trichonephila clavipes]
MDQNMSSVFGDYSQQVIQAPPAPTQEPQVLDTMPFLFDESNNLISFLDHFETGLAREQQEIPMDLTMPQLKKKLHASRRRVREMVDVVGRLGNASRRQRLFAHDESPTLGAGFGKTRAALA